MDIVESYVSGATDVPLIETTIGTCFDQIVARWPEREALVVCHQNVRWSYREFAEKVDTLAANFLRLGLRPGDRVGIWSPNSSEWVLTQFATAKAGLLMVNINPAYRRHELEYVLNKVACAALVMAPSFKSSDYLDILRSLAPELDVCPAGLLAASRLPHLKHVIRLGAEPSAGMHNFDSLLLPPAAADLAELAVIARTLTANDAINIQFTSGTTGSPKGATLTHRNILNNGFFVGEAMRLSEHDRLCIPVPLYHCFGMVLGNLACLTHGSAMIFPGEGFDPESVLRAVQSERCTALHGVPTMFIGLLDFPAFASFDLGSLRTGIMAGSPCPIEIMKRVLNEMHMEQVTIAYGMTETSPVSFQSSCNDPVERRVSTVGRIQPHVECKIVDSDGNTVACGEKGELLVRGYSIMHGYWGDPERTAEAVDGDGWMHTGDLGAIDAEGYCNIVGRAKDMVIRGGENIYPREVEEFLYAHPKVQDVQCVGVPDLRYGEELCACIVLHPGVSATESEIRKFCEGEIAHYKIPRYVRFYEILPMTVTGKIQKYLLRQRVTEELGLREQATA